MAEKTYTDYSKALLEAMEIMSNQAVQKATFDKTILGMIVSCTNAETGEYKIKVQDAYYYATVTNIEDRYSKGDQVYILIPGNDDTRAKKIIGSVQTLGDTYLATTTIESQYEKMSQNIISKNSEYPAGVSYCSFNHSYGEYDFLLYDAFANDIIIDTTTEESFVNKINIDDNLFTAVAQGAEKLQISAKFKTLIPQTQRRGNFGLKVDIEFYTDVKKIDTTTRSYILDTNSMTGTIYNMDIATEQKAILDFDGSIFKRVRRVSAFMLDFNEDSTITDLDVFIDDIGLFPMSNSTANAWNKHYLTFELPEGNTLTEDLYTININAKIAYKNREVENTDLEYYWFLEDGSVTSNSEGYCEYGGRGWRCLNQISSTSNKWISATNNYKITNNDTAATEALYKCVAVKKAQVLAENTITIYNKQALFSVKISSSMPSKYFYVDQGAATLKCQVSSANQNITLNADRFVFYWHRLNSQGNILDLDLDNGGTLSLSQDYSNKELKILLQGFKEYMNTFFKTAAKEAGKEPADSFNIENYSEFSRYEDLLAMCKVIGVTSADMISKKYTNKQVYEKIEKYINSTLLSYVDNNEFHNLRASIINSKNTFVCTVYEKITKDEQNTDYQKLIEEYAALSASERILREQEFEDLFKPYSSYRYIGTASTILHNVASPASVDYYAELTNASQLFKYDANGISPADKNKDPIQTIHPLSFILYDKNGVEIDITESESVEVKWYIPINDTMLLCDLINEENLTVDSTGEFYEIEALQLPFSIANTYDVKNTNNTIRLYIYYNGTEINLYTNFSFFKEGNSGTNGTDYFCKINPNTPTNAYPTIYCWIEKEPSTGKLYLGRVHGNFFDSYTREVGNRAEDLATDLSITALDAAIEDGEEEAPKEDLTPIAAAGVPWFDVELWSGGVQLEPDTVSWKILTMGSDNITPFTFASRQTSQQAYLSIHANNLIEMIKDDKKYNPNMVLQVKVSYKGRQFFATQPIALVAFLPNGYTVSNNDANAVRVEIDNGGGFNEAMYASDGVNPQYQTERPFELNVYYGPENISLNEASNSERRTPLEYQWDVFGKEPLNLASGEVKNQQYCTLPGQFNGYTVNNGMICRIGKWGSDNVFTPHALMFFPIHMYLNRYGHAHLNDWDGNSIEISEDEGYILSPQVGAGRKEDDNTFTGMLMGEVKGGTTQDKVGLVGYNHGAQTMFLNAETGGAYFGPANEIAIEPDGEKTQVKLGPWHVDNDSIWKDVNAFNTDGGIYIGEKGISFGTRFVFDANSNSGKGSLTIPGVVKENDVTIEKAKDLHSDQATIGTLKVSDIATIEDLKVSKTATIEDLTVLDTAVVKNLTASEIATIKNLTLSETATIKDLKVSNTADIKDLTVTSININGEEFGGSGNSDKPVKPKWVEGYVATQITNHNTEAEKKFASKTDIPDLSNYYTAKHIDDNYYTRGEIYTKEEAQANFVSISNINGLIARIKVLEDLLGIPSTDPPEI